MPEQELRLVKKLMDSSTLPRAQFAHGIVKYAIDDNLWLILMTRVSANARVHTWYGISVKTKVTERAALLMNNLLL